jgi:hypothetical protein
VAAAAVEGCHAGLPQGQPWSGHHQHPYSLAGCQSQTPETLQCRKSSEKLGALVKSCITVGHCELEVELLLLSSTADGVSPHVSTGMGTAFIACPLLANVIMKWPALKWFYIELGISSPW